MKSYTRSTILTLAIFTVICCNKAAAQLASEKPVTSFYSTLTKEKLAAGKQRGSSNTVAATKQLPSQKALPKRTMQAAESRKKGRIGVPVP